MKFQMTPVKQKPRRRYRRRSKYDQILEEFIKQKDDLVEVVVTFPLQVPGKDANYLRNQLNKRIDRFREQVRGLEINIKVSVFNDKVYLEKTKKAV